MSARNDKNGVIQATTGERLTLIRSAEIPGPRLAKVGLDARRAAAQGAERRRAARGRAAAT
jgi:hypothetical protein